MTEFCPSPLWLNSASLCTDCVLLTCPSAQGTCTVAHLGYCEWRSSECGYAGFPDAWWLCFGYTPRDGTVGSNGDYTFNFLKTLHTDFHSSCISFWSYLQYRRVPFSAHSCQHLWLFIFLVIAILTWVRLKSQGSFDLRFPNGYRCWTFFSYTS